MSTTYLYFLTNNLTMTNQISDTNLLLDRIRQQEQALADLAIERRADKLAIALLRLQCTELKASVDRGREAVDRRNEQIEDLKLRHRRSLLTAGGAQRALNRIRKQMEEGAAEGRQSFDGASRIP